MKNKNSENYSCLDFIRFVAAILIVGSHALPLFDNELFNRYYGQWFFRWCVPLFFLTTGFFYIQMKNEKKLSYLKRIGILYLFSTILYMPFIIDDCIEIGGTIIDKLLIFTRDILLGYNHLWYLSALFIALHIFSYVGRFRKALFVLPFLILGGIIFDKYYLIMGNDILTIISKKIYFWGGQKCSFFCSTNDFCWSYSI